MDKFTDRYDAGQKLAKMLRPYSKNRETIVLALPRGGVPIGYEIAKALDLPLDVFIVRKLGMPDHKELAMGAIASGNVQFMNEALVKQSHIQPDEIAAVLDLEKKELARRESFYRQNRPFPDLEDKTVILVDDGIATGATMHAAIQALRHFQPSKIVIAVPVLAADTYEEMRSLVNNMVFLLKPVHLNAVGYWYEDFSQTEDDEVIDLLNDLSGRPS